MGDGYASPPANAHNSHVNFSGQDDGQLTEVEEERKKYLTAKYGQHQMKLIRKRLAVEDWLDKELNRLYDVVSTVWTVNSCRTEFVFANIISMV